jgi:hypothetical protein
MSEYEDGFGVAYQYVIDYLSSQLDSDLEDNERRLVENLLDHFENNLDTDLI